MPDVLHGTTTYALRPDYDAVVAEFGDPPTGFPEECRFLWPDTSEADLERLAKEIAAIKREATDSVARLASQYRPAVVRDNHGRFVQKKETAGE